MYLLIIDCYCARARRRFTCETERSDQERGKNNIFAHGFEGAGRESLALAAVLRIGSAVCRRAILQQCEIFSAIASYAIMRNVSSYFCTASARERFKRSRNFYDTIYLPRANASSYLSTGIPGLSRLAPQKQNRISDQEAK